MKTRRTKNIALLATLLCLWQSPRLLAQIYLGVDTTSGGVGLVSGNGGLTLGWEFQVSAAEGIVVNGLGFWDYQSNGFGGQTFPVGLWSSATGTLLRSSVITSASTLEPSIHANGDWRVNAVTPMLLSPGLYRIGALMPVVGANNTVYSGTFQSGAGVSLVRFLRQIGSPTLAMPVIGPPYPEAIWFGPTFTYTPVPEPGSISLFLAGLGFLRVFASFKLAVRNRICH